MSVPEQVRGPFAAATPALVAAWSVGGLYLALGPSLAAGVLGVGNHLTGGLVVAALTAPAAVACWLTVDRPARRVMVGGAVWLGVGIALTLLALALRSTPGFFVATAVAGVGFGTSFLGAFRSLATRVEPQRRAELFAAVFALSYLAFSLPALAAGLAGARFGLEPTTTVYGLVVIGLSVAVPVLDRRH